MKITQTLTMLTLGSLIFTACADITKAIDSSKGNPLSGKSVTVVNKQGAISPYAESIVVVTGGISPINTAFEIEDAISDTVANTKSRNKSLRGAGKFYMNPSDMLSKKIMAHLVSKYKVRPKNNRIATIGSTKNPKNYTVYNADYVLNITNFWRTASAPFVGNEVVLKSNIQLVNSRTQKPILQYSCMYESMLDSGLKKKTYSKDEIYANNGKILKEVTTRAVSLCVQEIKQKALK